MLAFCGDNSTVRKSADYIIPYKKSRYSNRAVSNLNRSHRVIITQKLFV